MEATLIADRSAIRSSIEAMMPGFTALVEEIGTGGWNTKSGIPAYTCGQVAWHLASGTSFLAGEIAKAKDGNALNPPAFVRPILYTLSGWRVRIASRKATPETVRVDFDAAVQRLLAVLDSFDDETLSRPATRMGETLTMAALLHKPAEHLAEHKEHILAGLRQRSPTTDG